MFDNNKLAVDDNHCHPYPTVKKLNKYHILAPVTYILFCNKQQLSILVSN